MKIVALVLIFILAYCVYEAIRIRPLLAVSAQLVERAQPFTRDAGEQALLVLGDSTAVGVGAELAEETVAGRLAARNPEWAVENFAVSGAQIPHLDAQFAQATRDHYALVVIHIGANDIIRFKTATRAVAELEPQLEKIKAKCDKVIFLTAGNVGGTKFFPSLMNGFYERRTRAYHAAFESLAERLGIVYVNLYAPKDSDPFVQDAARFLSPDGLHPSGEGYRLWFEHIEKVL